LGLDRWHAVSRTRTLRLGDIGVGYAVDGVMAFPSDCFIPAMPGSWWSTHLEQLDGQARVVMAAGGLLVEVDGRALLIDAGWGVFDGESQFGPVRCGGLLDSLAVIGRSPEQIDVVAFTHLHIDHVGWVSRDGVHGPDLVFVNARHLVARTEWEPYLHGEVKVGAPSRERVLDPLAGRVEFFDDGEEIFPGVRSMAAAGHSPGHSAFVVRGGGQRLIVLGDAFHVPAQITHPEWTSISDLDTTAAIAARWQLLHELAEPDTLGFAFHFADVAFGRVSGRDRERVWAPERDAVAV